MILKRIGLDNPSGKKTGDFLIMKNHDKVFGVEFFHKFELWKWGKE